MISSIYISLSFLSLPASHLCHQGLGWPCIIVRSYLLAVNCDPAIKDLIFIMVNIYPGAGEGGSQLIFKPVHFIRVTIYPASLPYNINRGHYLPRGQGDGAYRLIFLTIYFIRVTIYLAMLSHNINRGHYLPCNTYCLVLACIKATIHIRPLRFCHDLANI